MSAPANITDVCIGDLVQRAIREGVWFPRDPSNPDGVQIRLHRSASAEGHRLADILRERRDDVNAFHAARRPAWPLIDDGLPPRLDPDEPDSAVFQIRLEAILAEDRIVDFIETEVAYVRGQIAGIVARTVAARRGITASGHTRMDKSRAVEFRGGKVVQR